MANKNAQKREVKKQKQPKASPVKKGREDYNQTAFRPVKEATERD
jgi:hypothetical protein